MKSIQAITIGTLVAASALFASVANASIVDWTISGPGTTSVATPSATETSLSYSLAPAGYSTVTWTASGVAATAGSYSFDWNYSGFHAYYNVTAFLNGATDSLVAAGPANCCTPPSGGFSYAGTYTFNNVSAGDILSFTMGGGNYDSNNVLFGTLTLDQTSQTSQIPEPTGLALIALGLVGLASSRRRSN